MASDRITSWTKEGCHREGIARLECIGQRIVIHNHCASKVAAQRSKVLGKAEAPSVKRKALVPPQNVLEDRPAPCQSHFRTCCMLSAVMLQELSEACY